MDEKLEPVLSQHRGEAPMTVLCAAYGISRKTGYKWLGRHREAAGPNDVRCIDFKGWFRNKSGHDG